MIIAFAGQKGGSGKTTSALNAAVEWMVRKKRVLLVDADPQGTARTWGAVATEKGIEAPALVSMSAGMHRKDQLPAVAAGFDVVVIDCPPGWETYSGRPTWPPTWWSCPPGLPRGTPGPSPNPWRWCNRRRT